ncbi:MAG TPA: His/Gly/Thr/Pro-type tRNA ligase C-terminal domain-containing protein, partial [Blastocatellia bacterium]|nr:His/Gly/Thr/Pro-type tRNA ligase C-terminal domain-containing protein [Blastocatellia bacterium]
CRAHFDEFRVLLEDRAIPYTIEPRLVRGLDYYMRTAFEITGSQLGAQNTIVGGGRYDGLSELIGGRPVKGFGFAFGMERMVLSLPETAAEAGANAPDLYIAYIGDEARAHSLRLASRLREAGVSVIVDLEGRKLKRSLAIADSLKVRRTLIVGEDEIRSGAYVLRDMASGEQKNLSEPEIITALKTR